MPSSTGSYIKVIHCMFLLWLLWIRLQLHVFRVLDTLKASMHTVEARSGTLGKVSSYSKLVLAKAPSFETWGREIESTSPPPQFSPSYVNKCTN